MSADTLKTDQTAKATVMTAAPWFLLPLWKHVVWAFLCVVGCLALTFMGSVEWIGPALVYTGFGVLIFLTFVLFSRNVKVGAAWRLLLQVEDYPYELLDGRQMSATFNLLVKTGVKWLTTPIRAEEAGRGLDNETFEGFLEVASKVGRIFLALKMQSRLANIIATLAARRTMTEMDMAIRQGQFSQEVAVLRDAIRRGK